MFNPLTRDDYNKVVEEFSDMIFRIAYQNLCNIADAEDVVQEVFISLLKSKGKIFNDSEHAKSYENYKNEYEKIAIDFIHRILKEK